MKTLSGKVILVALAIVAVIALLGLHACATGSRQESAAPKKFKYHKQIVGPGPNQYRELKVTQQVFDARLIALEVGHRGDHGKHHLKFLCKDGENATSLPYNPHSSYNANDHPKCQIRTAKVTKYEGPNIATTDASAANDPNTVQHLYSDFQGDIDAVVACFK